MSNDDDANNVVFIVAHKTICSFFQSWNSTKCKRVSCVCIIICYLNPVKTLMITHNGGGCYVLYVVNIFWCVKFDIWLFITSAPRSIETVTTIYGRFQQIRRVNYHDEHAKATNKFDYFVAPSIWLFGWMKFIFFFLPVQFFIWTFCGLCNHLTDNIHWIG